jgi:outer membrane protein assembly factor BamB
MNRRRTLLLTACTLGWVAPLAGGGAQDQDEVQRAFHIYNTQAARALQDDAQEHLAAGRWSEGLAALQRILEDHRGDVLGATRPLVRGVPTGDDVHEGAAEWAYQRLFQLNDEARTLYRERHEARSRLALVRAVEGADRVALATIGRRWPLTDAAQRAFWALGDLEFEGGHHEAGIHAWARALALTLGRPQPPRAAQEWVSALEDFERRLLVAPELVARAAGVRRRGSRALAHLGAADDGSPAPAPPPRHGTAIAQNEDFGRPFSSDTDSWPETVTLPAHPFRDRQRLYPAREGDTIFVNTSRDVLAVGAFSGEVEWSTQRGDLLGWDRVTTDEHKYSEAVDTYNSVIAPAVSDGVVVATLQVPTYFEDARNFQDLEIIKVIPERRLVAFDARTGMPLWDTLPPDGWDGESGSFAERVTVVGSPVIHGTRVIVPTARLRGRIEFHVGCFDLFSGGLLWSTPLITGQRELNMFGRSMTEFTAPPVRVVGDRVVVQTQLGTLSCVDLFTGDPLWVALYPQIPVQPGRYYQAGELPNVWANAPPITVGDTIVCTPFDCAYLLGVDLASGAQRWKVGHTNLTSALFQANRLTLTLLAGADERRVYLAGRKVACFEVPGGSIHESAPVRRDWVFPPDNETLLSNLPRPVLGRDRVYVPTSTELVALDRRSGKRLSGHAWVPDRGNLLLSDGMMFTLSSSRLQGYFEWDAMIERARARQHLEPDVLEHTTTLALLLLNRGVAERQRALGNDGRGLPDAMREIAAARAELERAIAGPETEAPEALRKALHQVLSEQALTRRLQADPRGALHDLQRALPLASTRAETATTLLVMQALQRGREEGDRRATLTRLLEEFGDRVVVCNVETDSTADGPWSGRLTPMLASLDASRGAMDQLPMGLWALIERAESRRGARSVDESRHEFEDLHRILHTYGGEPVFGATAGEWATARIGEKLASGHGGYEDFEQRAEVLLGAAQARGDLDALARVPLLFPFSKAAGRANDARIDASLSSGDADLVAGIVLGELPDRWHPSQASARELEHLLNLARVLGESGNLRLRAALTTRLAEYHPTQRVEGRALREWAAAWAAEVAPREPAPESSFTAAATSRQDYKEHYVSCGLVPPDGADQRPVLVFAKESGVYAFRDDAGEPLWRHSASYQDRLAEVEGRVVTTPGRVHVASPRRVYTLGREDGEEVWSWEPGLPGKLVALFEANGVLVALQNHGSGDPTDDHLFVGLDAARGVELWRMPVRGTHFRPLPVLGEGRMVLMPTLTSGRAQVFDLFTGRASASFVTDMSAMWTVESAWIEDGRLVLPNFRFITRPSHNHVQAIDLETGELVWRVAFSAGGVDRELSHVLTWEDKRFLVLWTQTPSGALRGGLFELNTRLGALDASPIAEFPEGSKPVGLPPMSHTELTSPYLFVTVGQSGGPYTLRAVHVRYGQRWETELPDEFNVTRASDLPLPAISTSTVAVSIKRRMVGGAMRGLEPYLLFFDRGTGTLRGTYNLPARMISTPERLDLTPFGDGLFVSGSQQMDYMK